MEEIKEKFNKFFKVAVKKGHLEIVKLLIKNKRI